ncbi:MAG TPA: VWA domain-containing protein [Candidatus Elarobacter sp.]|nr:VWA domain-containing protein [Candidatus Elarobacter sp.]
MTDFTGSIAAFTATLRERHGFGVGNAATHLALRAAELVGVQDGERLRRAFRTVYAATPEEAARFDAAFDEFFFGAQGIAQPNLASRNTRPPHGDEHAADRPTAPPKRRDSVPPDPTEDDAASRTAEQRPVDDASSPAAVWQTLRARYSPTAARAEPPVIPLAGLDAMLRHATRLTTATRIARSRRRTASPRGDRIDLRRTLRASVETAGDPIALRRTARALRSARFVLLIDGSRSASEHAGPMLQFAYALVQRSRRAHAFVFSTALRDVTAELRERGAPPALRDLGEAWGGGTRIGDNLLAFVREHGSRLLSPETVVFVFSDGLDVGNLDRLERAMRELRSRAAAIVWLNPHAGTPGFAPAARGMRTALPYLTMLRPARDEADFAALAHALTRRPAR